MDTMITQNARSVAASAYGFKSGSTWRLPCPVHDGKDKNLSIWDTPDGQIGARCWSHECDYRAIIAALGVEDQRVYRLACAVCGLATETRNAMTHTATYYTAAGDAQCVHRYGDKKGLPGIYGERAEHLRGQAYQILEWPVDGYDGRPVVVEGEKTAAAVQGAGVIAYSWMGGAGRAGHTDLTPLGGQDEVVLWPDNDLPGLNAMRAIADGLARLGVAVAWVDQSDIPDDFGDAADMSDADIRDRVAAAVVEPRAPAHGVSRDWTREIYDIEPHDWMIRLVRQYASELLIVYDDQTDTSVLKRATHAGVWRDVNETIERMLIDISMALYDGIRQSPGITMAEQGRIAKAERRMKDPAYRANVARALGGVAAMRRHHGAAFPGLTDCVPSDIDSHLRYIGAPNGVIELDTGRLLTGRAARDCLVSMSIPDPYDPAAQSADVDALFEHLTPTDREWLLDAMGFALRGYAERRFYILQGDPGGGKSTLFDAVRKAFGEYASQIQPNTLAASRGGPRADAAQSGTDAICDGRRLAFLSETPASIDWLRVKELSGETGIRYRVEYKASAERRLTATMFWASNPVSMPDVPVADKALAERARILPYAPIPEDKRDVGLRERLQLNIRSRQALVALLVRHAKKQAPPSDVQSVADARAELERMNLGPAGAWLKAALFRERGAKTRSVDLWAAAKIASGDADGDMAFGKKQREITNLAKNLHGLGAVKNIRIGATVGTGWRDVRLRSQPDIEAILTAGDDDPPPVRFDYGDGDVVDIA